MAHILPHYCHMFSVGPQYMQSTFCVWSGDANHSSSVPTVCRSHSLDTAAPRKCYTRLREEPTDWMYLVQSSAYCIGGAKTNQCIRQWLLSPTAFLAFQQLQYHERATRHLSGNQDRGYSWSKLSLDWVPGLDVRTRNEIYQELTFLLPTCGSALGCCLFCVYASVGVFKHREQMNMKTQISRPTWKPKPTKSLYSFSYFQHICLLWSLIDSASEMYLVPSWLKTTLALSTCSCSCSYRSTTWVTGHITEPPTCRLQTRGLVILLIGQLMDAVC